MILKLLNFCCILLATAQVGATQEKGQINLADPTIFYHHKTYYLYGTVEGKSDDGFRVYTSKDKIGWKEEGTVLKKGEAFGSKGFWAPQVFIYRKKFYMAYVANEQIAIAEANSPLGPFRQKEQNAIVGPVKMIDPYVFFDKGKIYLYHVRLQKGNKIFVSEMNKDLKSIKENTTRECLEATEQWENTAKSDWGVTEGPTVLKRGGKYYLFYSANDFRNPNYAVGYAVSDNPMGPWKKFSSNPILSIVQSGLNGTGHGDFSLDRAGNLDYVFHTHQSNQKVGPRRTAIIRGQFQQTGGGTLVFKFEPQSFIFLTTQ